MACSFLDKLTRRIKEYGTILCVGVDPNIPCGSVVELSATELRQLAKDLHAKCTYLIKKTSDSVCCFKFNVAFFEQYGPGGMEVRYPLQGIPKVLHNNRPSCGTLHSRSEGQNNSFQWNALRYAL